MAHAESGKELDQLDRALEGIGPLEMESDGELAFPLGGDDLIGRRREA